ncbi:DUF3592 domain-containing protein [Streptomyces sp. NPDC088810]|uniref:DUF3592 domain-containing protein n=1 Tax=Streptomyces sp. NPDC088810 TaxID=3365904 RepID=UPI0037F2CA04
MFGIVLVHTYRKYRSARLLQASGIETTGVCTFLSWHDGEASVSFSYTLPDGTEHSADSVHVHSVSVSPGDTVRVFYDAASPERAELASLLDTALRIYRKTLIGLVPATLLFLGMFLTLAVAVVITM